MRNISNNVKNKVLRKRENKLYYFDENGVYRCIPIEEAKTKIEKAEIKLDNIYMTGDNEIEYRYWELCEDMGIQMSYNLLKKAICKLNEGDTIEVFSSYLSTVTLDKHSKPQGVDRFITKIENPEFVREPENIKKNTFDFIHVEVNIVTEWEQDRMQYIRDNENEIKKMVINKIENSKRFQKFGIPTNLLNLSKCTLSDKYNFIQFVFEVKKI